MTWENPDDPQAIRILEARARGYRQIQIDAGPRGHERIVPPAGEEYAFDIYHWARRLTLVVSPTGRSVRVWVDGQEIKPPNRKEPR